MCSQARNNQKLIRPNPAVPNATYANTQNLTAMTTKDISSSAELMCCTERAHRRSRNPRNAIRGTYVAAHIIPIFYYGYSLVTSSAASQS